MVFSKLRIVGLRHNLYHSITSLQYSPVNALLCFIGGSNDKDHPPFETIDANCFFSNLTLISNGISKTTSMPAME
jgi:hypothetical protein